MKKVIFLLCILITNQISVIAQDGWMLQDSKISNTINSLYFLDNNRGYAAANGGVFLKTVNSGSSWSTVSTGTTDDLLKVIFTSSTNGFLLTKKGKILQTLNSGDSWLSQSVHTLSLNGAAFIGSKGILVGDEGFVATTNNNGTLWSVQDNLGVYALNDVAIINDTLAITVGANGVIFRTGNGGVSWSSIKSGTINSFSACSFSNGMVVIVGSGGKIYNLNPFTNELINKSSSAITTWLKDIDCTNTNYCTATGFGSTFLINHFGAWVSRPLESIENFNAVAFPSDSIGFIAGLNGAIYKTTTGGYPISTLDVIENNYSFYPNPVENFVQLNLFDTQIKQGILKIFNSDGAEVFHSLINSNQSKLDLSEFNTGIYLFTFQAENKFISGKFVKL